MDRLYNLREKHECNIYIYISFERYESAQSRRESVPKYMRVGHMCSPHTVTKRSGFLLVTVSRCCSLSLFLLVSSCHSFYCHLVSLDFVDGSDMVLLVWHGLICWRQWAVHARLSRSLVLLWLISVSPNSLPGIPSESLSGLAWQCSIYMAGSELLASFDYHHYFAKHL